MNKRVLISLITIGFIGSIGAWANDKKGLKMPPPKAGSAEFEQIKKLAGKWTGISTHMGQNKPAESVTTQFRVTAAGSAVEEIIMSGTPHEMVDMYTDENGRLAMTHYCAIGNQPHMLLRQASPHMIRLEMGPTQGISPNSHHMHSLTLEFIDADHLIERWTSYREGKPAETVVFTLARVK